MNQKLDLSLILPCFNEGETFQENVPKILETLDSLRLSYEVIFVDDGSQDGTRGLILSALTQYPDKTLRHIFHEKNLGRGAAVRTGFAAAQGSVRGFIDIDLEVRADYILPCWLALENGADVAVGRRIYRVYWHSLFRHFLSRGYAGLVRLVLQLPFRDTESGYKFFREEALAQLLPVATNPGWFWDTQVMTYAHRMRYRVVEIPCLFQRRFDKTSTVKPFREALAYLRHLWRARIELRSRPELLVRTQEPAAHGQKRPNHPGRPEASTLISASR